MFDIIQSIDTEIILFIQNNLRVSFLNPIMIALAYLGQVGAIWVIISLILIAGKKYRTAGIFTIITMALCYVINDMIIKELVARPRPFDTIPELIVLTWKPSSWSFPSGHACSSFAAAFTLTKFMGKKGSLFYILAFVIAISRPYVGVHYLSDIIAGSIIGTLGSGIIYLSVHKAGLINKSPTNV